MNKLLTYLFAIVLLGSCVVGEVQLPKEIQPAQIPLAITAVTPTSGLQSTTQLVTITGTKFEAGVSVTVGASPCSGVTILSETSLTCNVPSLVAGTYNVRVTNLNGDTSTLASAYTYTLPAPTISSVAATSTAVESNGGQSVTILGSNFQSGASVSIDGVNCGSVIFVSGAELRCTSAAMTAGTKTTIVTNPDGQSTPPSGSLVVNQSAPTVTSISPNAGPLGGTTPVRIRGTNFIGVTNVMIGTVTCGSISVVDETTIDCITPAGTATDQSVEVTNAGGTNAANTFYSYQDAPVVTGGTAGISPRTGAAAGGTSITISGQYFRTDQPFPDDGESYPKVRVDGIDCANIVVTGPVTAPQTITCDVPTPTSLGTKDIVITNADNQTVTVTGGYTYQNTPTVASVSPSGGPIAGLTLITITGEGFDGTNGATVELIDGATTIGCTGPVVTENASAADTITCTTANATTTRSVQIRVTNNNGDPTQTVTSAGTLYTFRDAPTVTTPVSPTAGDQTGGTTLTIDGTGFIIPGATVTVGGIDCPVNNGISTSTRIVCTTGDYTGTSVAQTTVDVRVTNPDTQTSGATGNNAYTYQPAPVVNTIAPLRGTTNGNTAVTINGQNFYTGATVRIGSVNCTGVAINPGGTQITCNTGLRTTAGLVGVQITNTDTQVGTLNNAYTYLADPTITNLSRSGGPVAGNSSLTITGTDFNTITGVDIGGTACAIQPGQTDSSVTCLTGNNTIAEADQDVTITNAEGRTGVLAGSFTYGPGPTVASVTPPGGLFGTNVPITISGSNFQAGAEVYIDGSACTGVNVTVPNTITCTTPALSLGDKDVRVVNPDLQEDTLSGPGFIFDNTPTFTSITSTAGQLTGNTAVTIIGNNFASGVDVKIGGSDCTGISISMAGTQIDCNTPNLGTAGDYDLVITNPSTLSVTETDAFTYQVAPTVTSVSPAVGRTSGNEVVTINGQDFDTVRGIHSVDLGAQPCINITNLTATSFDCETQAQAAGTVSVTVRNNDGDQQSGTLASAFTFFAPPVVTSLLTATNGPASGGTTIRINGSGFINSGSTTITVGGVTCTNFNFIDANTIECDTGPTSVYGLSDVTVTNFDGQTDTGANLFTYDPPPIVTNISSFATGRLTGGNTVTITGSNFSTGTLPTVRIGGNDCTPVAETTPTTVITCTAPDGSIGAAPGLGQTNVEVENPDGQIATVTNGYEYVAAPTIVEVVPNILSAGVASSITIRGSGFIAGPSLNVTINDGTSSFTCTGASVNGAGTEVSCTTNSGHVIGGASTVSVTNGDGSETTVSSANIITFVTAPNISSLGSTSGPIAGGGTLVINGTDLVSPPAIKVEIGGNDCPVTNVTSAPTQIECTIPAGSEGAQNVIVTTYDRITSNSSPYTYIRPPVVSSISPNYGPTTAGKTVTISGSYFYGTPTIDIGGTACAFVSLTGSGATTSIDCTLGGTVGVPATVGSANVQVTNPDTQSDTETAIFTYNDVPQVTSLSPDNGSEDGVTGVTINGQDFYDTSTVDIGGAPCANVNVVNSTTITCDIPARTPGAHNVTVTSDGVASAALVGGWTAEAVPAVTLVTPNSGNLSGGTVVEVQGTNFVGDETDMTVTFNGVAGTILGTPAPTATSLYVTVPGGASTGSVDVIVTNNTDQASPASVGAYTYTPDAAELQFDVATADPYLYGTTNSNVTYTFTLRNNGSITTSPISLSLTGADTGAFFVASPGSGDNCSTVSLAPAASCTIQVTFLGGVMPAATTFNATLNATDGTTSDTNGLNGITP